MNLASANHHDYVETRRGYGLQNENSEEFFSNGDEHNVDITLIRSVNIHPFIFNKQKFSNKEKKEKAMNEAWTDISKATGLSGIALM